MHIDELYDLKEKLTKELIEQGKKDGTLNNIDTLAHAIKNIIKIIESCEEDEYSGRRYSYAMPRYSMNMMPDYSMAYGSITPASGRYRDSRGRYSSHNDLVSELVLPLS